MNGSGNCEAFSDILRNLIKSTGLSLYEISKATKISYANLISYKNGRICPGMESLIKLADYFAVPIDYLIGRCSLKEAKAISEDYPSFFMELRRAPYEAYLVGRKSFQKGKIGESPWPYNLMDDVFCEEWKDQLSDDQIAGIDAAMNELTEKERECVMSYYHDGMTLEAVAKKQRVTRERMRQIIAKAVRKLRAPHRKSLMMYGVKGTEERSALHRFRNELEQEAAALSEYEKQLTEKKVQLCDIGMNGMHKTADLNMDLCEMDLSVRSYNCLRRNGCSTLGDVINVVESGNLLNVRNLGRRSAEEILKNIYSLTGQRYTETGQRKEDIR